MTKGKRLNVKDAGICSPGQSGQGLTETEKSRLCVKCQRCCNTLYIPLAVGPYFPLNLYATRGIKIIWKSFQPYAIIENIPCQHLTEEGCSIYEKRPFDCKIYDGRNDIFYPEKCKWPKEENA
jgi:Fe-S-cluster containining protein